MANRRWPGRQILVAARVFWGGSAVFSGMAAAGCPRSPRWRLTGTKGISGDGGPPFKAELNFPADVTKDQSGSIYIADTGHGVVGEVLPTGKIITIAGDGRRGFAADDRRADSTTLDAPRGVPSTPLATSTSWTPATTGDASCVTAIRTESIAATVSTSPPGCSPVIPAGLARSGTIGPGDLGPVLPEDELYGPALLDVSPVSCFPGVEIWRLVGGRPRRPRAGDLAPGRALRAHRPSRRRRSALEGAPKRLTGWV